MRLRIFAPASLHTHFFMRLLTSREKPLPTFWYVTSIRDAHTDLLQQGGRRLRTPLEICFQHPGILYQHGMLKIVVSKSAGEKQPEAYPLGYVEDCFDPR